MNNTFVVLNTKDISLEELKELKQHGVETIVVPFDQYQIDEFIKIKETIEDIKRIIPSKEEINSEKKVFSCICLVLSNLIDYDQAAEIGLSFNEDAKKYEDSTNLKALLKKCALSRGYAEILRNLLSEYDIKSEVVESKVNQIKEEGFSMCWNKVNLDGVWYNCDLSVDGLYLQAGITAPMFLKNDEELKRQNKISNEKDVLNCSESIDDKTQESLIKEAKIAITKKIIEDNNEEANDVMLRLKKFLKIKKR